MGANLEAASGPEFAAELVARAAKKGADHAQVDSVQSERFELDADTRRVNLLRTTIDEDTSITVFLDGKKGVGSVNGRDEAAVTNALENAMDAASAGMSDDANQIADAPSGESGWYGEARADREAMLDALSAHLELVRRRYAEILTRHAIYTYDDRRRAFANSNGVHQEERRASYSFGTMFAAKRGDHSTSFNYTGAASYTPFGELIQVGTVRRLMEETLQSFNPRPVPEKFIGDVIVTPECLSSLMGSIASAVGGYALMAETTPFKNSRGERIASDCFNLFNQPRFEEFPHGADFDAFGVPTVDTRVIENGVLQDFLVDFYISKKLGLPQTGGRNNFVVPAGDTSFEALVGETQRGIILSRFSGGQPNNNLDFSGVAKNSFYVEDGEVRFPLIETMIAGNFQELLKNIRAVSRESVNFGGSRYPYLVASGVTISGK